jgi:hypothetical protein
MAAVGIAFLFALFALVAPLALYWFVREEDPDPDRTTSWREAREGASEDVYGSGNEAASDRESGFGSDRESEFRSDFGDGSRSDRGDGSRSDRDDRDRRTRGDRDDDGNHWG